MKSIPNCKICKLKCCGCENYNNCLMRKEIGEYKIEDCIIMASKYYLYEEYLDSPNMRLCKFQDECKSLVEAWR